MISRTGSSISAQRWCRFCGRLPKSAIGNHAGLQVIRSSTSAFANYGEVQSAESRRDFVHKLQFSLKELEAPQQECEEVTAILYSSVRTCQRNGENPMSNVE